jgi:hypothetical protein
MPQPSSTPPEVVEAAVRRRARRIGETRTCDRCMRTSGMDTQWFWLKGTVQERTRFFAGLDPRMTDQVARRLAGRRIGFAQLCADCAAERQLPISATYGDINRVRETGVTALIGMAILDLHANMVPAAFRRR